MDFNSIQHLGELRQQEILERVQQDRAGAPLPAWWRLRLGWGLIALGQKLASAASLNDGENTTLVNRLHRDV